MEARKHIAAKLQRLREVRAEHNTLQEELRAFEGLNSG